MSLGHLIDVVTDLAGNAITNARIIIKVQSNGALATIYSDAGGTSQIANSEIAVDDYGTFECYAATGIYKAEVYIGTSLVKTRSYLHIVNAEDLTDAIADIATLVSDLDALEATVALMQTGAGGLGTMALQNKNAVDITGGTIVGITDLAIADGGTGAGDAANARTNLGLGSIATQAANNVAITGGTITGITDLPVADGGTGASNAADARTNLGARASTSPVPIGIACGDETTAITAGNGKVTFRMPFAMTLTAVRASLTTAQTSGNIFTVDINEGGASILSTKLTADNGEKTSTTAAAAAVISDASLADDAEITIDVDQIGDGTAKGLKVWLIGYPT